MPAWRGAGDGDMVGVAHPGVVSSVCVSVAGTVMDVLPRVTNTPFPLASTSHCTQDFLN